MTGSAMSFMIFHYRHMAEMEGGSNNSCVVEAHLENYNCKFILIVFSISQKTWK
jgi:hypothetical protein